jgi:hypothetical protein
MKRLIAAALFAALLAPLPAQAQTQSAEGVALTQCIQRSTTTADNTLLTQWIFIAMARHPSVSQLATVPDAERVTINRNMAGLFNRLLLQDCRTEARAAFRRDGMAALDAPFGAFGERAMDGLMDHPDVNAGVAEMTSYFDMPGFRNLLTQQ